MLDFALCVRSLSRVFCALAICFAMMACAHAFVGVNDPESAAALDRFNTHSRLIRAQDYGRAAQSLLAMRKTFVANPYGLARIDNELADLRTYRLLDIEGAIEVDTRLISLEIAESDSTAPRFLPKHLVANNRLLLDKDHYEQYALASANDIRESARKRLALNAALLSGRPIAATRKYDASALTQIKAEVLADYEATRAETADRTRIVSRLLRVDYEFIKIGTPSFAAEQYMTANGIGVDRLDFGEINLLDLSDYLKRRYEASKEKARLEDSLRALFLPYRQLATPSHRWTYSKLVNERVNDLVFAHLGDGDVTGATYYANLNKSRILMETRIATGANGASISASDISQDLELDRFGLPSKEAFARKLQRLPLYLDFYVAGGFADRSSSITATNVAGSDANVRLSRDFVAEAVDVADRFVASELLVTLFEAGKPVGSLRVSSTALAELQREFDASYVLFARRGPVGQQAPSIVKTIQEWLRARPGTIIVSPDKWMARHSFDALLARNTIRALNLFTSGQHDFISSSALVGFFNPTEDLPGADREAERVAAHFRDARLFSRSLASVSAFTSAPSAPVLHLAMHGAFDSANPLQSKLLFHNAIKRLGPGDPNAVYAKDMTALPLFRGRDLVFAAACQTGLIAADDANESEIVGMLRPLLSGGNRNVILSLWKVDDAATADFVDEFYKRLAATRNVRTSFFAAQEEVRRRYDHPYFWAAFYLAQSN